MPLLTERIVHLEKGYPNSKEIREKACHLLDDYGRKGIYSTKECCFEIMKQVEAASE